MVCAIVSRDRDTRVLRMTVPAPSSTHASPITAPAMRQRAAAAPRDVAPHDQPPHGHHGQHRQRRHRQIHPALGAHLGGNRHDAGGRRQRDEDPRAQEPEHRPPPQRHQRQDAEPHAPARRGRSRRRAVSGARQAVIEHERLRPHRQPQVPRDQLQLVEEIVPRGRRRCRSPRSCRGSDHRISRQHDPRRGQAGIERTAARPTPRATARTGTRGRRSAPSPAR